jgi:hypothetical protein
MVVPRNPFLPLFRVAALLLAFSSMSLPQSAPDASGVGAEWNTRESILEMSKHIGKVKPILDQLRPKEWESKGAPEAYGQQLASTLVELRGVEWALGNLSGKPEKLSFALDAYFRVQSFRSKVNSMAEAVRRYQNPAVAELIDAYLTDSSASQIQLQQYVQELTELKEAEFDVMSQEAQRCRVQQIQRGNRRN